MKMSRYSTRFTGYAFPRWTPAVKVLIISCVVAFFVQTFDSVAGGPSFTPKFGLNPYSVTHNFYLWQLVTYIFLHDSLFHILFNMLGLWMFGSELESLWGTRQFTKFFFICGIGAGLLTVMLSPGSITTTIGASGAIYGILAAYGLLFPNRIIILYIFPIPAKWFVLGLGVMAFLSSLSAAGSGVAHVAHLGGMLCGLIYLRGGRMIPGIRAGYDRWKRNRLRRKFEIYYNERKRDDDQQKWRRWRN
ncbi:MAG: rhomboid family intramembrane serine protease [Acidobacteria bacterium]|nr:rhomboid family intramembrane serine protease [Acidobacteriota bacterium]